MNLFLNLNTIIIEQSFVSYVDSSETKDEVRQ